MLIVVSPNIYASGLTCSSAAAKTALPTKRTTCRDAVRIGLRLSPERNLGSGLEFEADGRRMKSKSRGTEIGITGLRIQRPLLNQPTSNCAHVAAAADRDIENSRFSRRFAFKMMMSAELLRAR
ncbi:hypothetical protein EVAR_23909_1 [Eumeta japonica]|uniref:Uncharacterized protein n=1 Tax=Eumeta variegata TaxID=151549 RepID=A0A4C1V1U0_EUMVA|nr:hypothetical protein EVAR_23909_1 [Eumeta japonica]